MSKYCFIILMVLILTACQNNKESYRAGSVQSNVIVLEQKFEINGLNRERQIRIYLPQDYYESDQKFPVVYMHDGQNLFDDSTSYAVEWGVDERLNQLAVTSAFKLIVVGIDHGDEKRLDEMSIWESRGNGKAEGEEYLKFIVNQVKPFIDSTYRTLPDRDKTTIIGSSMGGFISLYAIYRYPEVFGKAGIFSATLYTDMIYNFTLNNPIPKDSRLFLLVGGNEGDMKNKTEKMYRSILKSRHPPENLNLIIDPKMDHNEILWSKQFIPSIRWLYSK